MDTIDRRERTGGRPKLLLPIYQSIADKLESEIVAGQLPVGDKLESEVELCGRFGAGRHTIREALRVLRDKGMIERTPGRGSVVISRNPEPRRYTQNVSTLNELLRYPEGVKRRHISTGECRIKPEVAAVLGLKPGSRWMRISGVRELEGMATPIGWFDIYMALEFASLVQNKDIETMTLHEEIERNFGVQIERAKVDMFVTRIPADIADHLKCEPEAPALTTVRRYHSSTGDVVQASIAMHPEKRYTYSMEFVRSD